MPTYTLLIGPMFLGLSWLIYRAAFLVAASRANKTDLPAIVRAMKRLEPLADERDNKERDDNQGPPSLPML